ncbi:MAG: hypothetical protein Q8Q03_00395 [bacterium]|nr:hypothetical protein [bacterium]
MINKYDLKEKAIKLRKEGLTYSEILKQIFVAKSTLSLWLRSVSLAFPQKQKFSEKKILAQKRGAEARRSQRIEKQRIIYNNAKIDVGNLSKRELWITGVALYWAEGSKEKEWRPGSSVEFTNSDSGMVKFFINWLEEFCNVKKEDLDFSLFIHKNSKNALPVVKGHWSEVTGFPVGCFDKVFFKMHNVKTKRKNTGDLYYGCLKVRVKASSILLRQITGWMRSVNTQKIIE